MANVAIIVVSYNVRAYLRRSLERLAATPHDVIVVDVASTDGSAEAVAAEFPSVRLVALERNVGYGAAANAGIAQAGERDYLLVMNADAWPVDAEDVDRLVLSAEHEPGVGAAGPRLVDPDGSLQPSVRGFPTPWRLATEFLFLRWLGRRTRALNAFYGAGFDHRTARDAEFLVGAVLLLRSRALGDAGAFDPDFFMFDEEVDLCYRLRRAGWRVTYFPEPTFVHVGGASTRQTWAPMLRETLRSHLRFLAKHQGPSTAERARRVLLWAFRVRRLLFAGKRRRLSAETARWLGSADAQTLISVAPSPQRGAAPEPR